jgi:hypothetical protein
MPVILVGRLGRSKVRTAKDAWKVRCTATKRPETQSCAAPVLRIKNTHYHGYVRRPNSALALIDRSKVRYRPGADLTARITNGSFGPKEASISHAGLA